MVGLETNGFAGAGPEGGTSDGEGRFRIVDLPEGKYTLWTSHPEYPDGRTPGVDAGMRDVRIRLESSARLVVTVGRPDGRPESAFWLTVRCGQIAVASQAVNDPAGRVELDRMPAQTCSVLARSLTDRAFARAETTVKGGPTPATLRLTLAPGATVSGRVIDRDTRAPIQGAEVLALGDENEIGEPNDRSTPSGRFEIRGLSPGAQLKLAVRGPAGYLFDWKPVTVPASGDLDLGEVPLVPGERKVGDLVGVGANLDFGAEGPVVKKLAPDMSAARAGMKEGDVITSVDGRAVDNLGIGVMRELLAGEKGTTVRIEVRRNGTPMTIDVVR